MANKAKNTTIIIVIIAAAILAWWRLGMPLPEILQGEPSEVGDINQELDSLNTGDINPEFQQIDQDVNSL